MNHDHGAIGSVSSDHLLAQEDWLRGLAGRMVDPADVDDLVQDTWVEAIKQPLAIHGSLRGWLRTVVARLAQRCHRTARRRQRRERFAAGCREVPATDDELVWLELRQRLTAAVMALREPYRGTLLMRFYDGWSAREIAHRTHTPIATVRIRLQRGVQHLRDEMCRHCGPDWRPRLAAFALPTGGLGLWPATRRLALLGSAAALCIAAVAVLAPDAGPALRSPDRVAVAATTDPAAPLRPATAPAVPPRASLPVRKHATPTRQVAGRVLDPRGHALPGVEIVFRRVAGAAFDGPDGRRLAPIESRVLGRADHDGRFDLPCPPGHGGLAAQGRVVPICLWPIRTGDRQVRNARVIAARAVPLSGVVVDEHHRGIPGVRVAARCEQLPEFPAILDRQLFAHPLEETVTDADGRFRIEGFPLGCPARLLAAKAGLREVRLVPATDGRPLRIAMTRAHGDDPMQIAGRIFDRHGRVVCAAVVGVASHRTRSDSAGEYRLELAEIGDQDVLYAGKQGYRTAVERDIAARLRRHRGGTLFVDLTLGPPPRTLTGVVTDGRGVPLPDHLVFLADPFFVDGHALSAEALAAGQLDEPLGAGGRSDTTGRFSIGGLDDRDYRLRVLDPSHANTVDGGTHRAGDQQVRVVIPRQRFVTVAGRLLDDAGEAVTGAKVYFGCAPRKGSTAAMQLRDPVTSDANGRFTLRRVPRAGGRVYVVGNGDDQQDPGIVPTIFELERNTLDSEELELRIARLCHFRVHAPNAPRKSTIHLLDEYGRDSDILVKHANGCNHYESWTLEGDTTQVLCASQRARTLVLVGPDGAELARVRILLDPGYITEIDL